MIPTRINFQFLEQLGGLGPCFLIGLNIQLYYFFLMTTLLMLLGVVACVRGLAHTVAAPQRRRLMAGAIMGAIAFLLGAVATVAEALVLLGVDCRDVYGQPEFDIVSIPWATLVLMVLTLVLTMFSRIRITSSTTATIFAVAAGVLGLACFVFGLDSVSNSI